MPGNALKDGNADTPQLFEMMSTLVFPVNFHSCPVLSNPADHSHP